MFESIVNFLSPAALPNSILREAVAASPASKRMTRRTRSSLESAVATDMEPDFDHAHDPVGVDFSGPLLTPEASRSETSSNIDLVPGDEKPVTRRRSGRVTRMSLRGLENLREMEEDNNAEDVEASSALIDVKTRTVSGETLINSIVESRASRSSLKNDNSTTAINGHSWSQTTLLRENTETDENPHLATPDSKRSEESEDVQRRQSLRSRPAKEQTPESTIEETTKPTNKPEKSSPPRRSSRLSLVTKATEVLDRAASVLGKRSRDAMEKAVLKRRASLRPRHSLPANDDLASSSQLPDAKKRRVSEGDILSKKLEAGADENGKAGKPNPAAPQCKTKRWLEQGLYTGQVRDYDARLNEANNKIKASRRKTPIETQRKILPLPMFAGERLLKNGRDFKLPFDIFSPLPPGQPKPDEWKKVNRSKFSILCR
jgi:[histone H3]-lysine4 N-trimethyltransferase ASH1L